MFTGLLSDAIMLGNTEREYWSLTNRCPVPLSEITPGLACRVLFLPKKIALSVKWTWGGSAVLNSMTQEFPGNVLCSVKGASRLKKPWLRHPFMWDAKSASEKSHLEFRQHASFSVSIFKENLRRQAHKIFPPRISLYQNSFSEGRYIVCRDVFPIKIDFKPTSPNVCQRFEFLAVSAQNKTPRGSPS